MEAKVDIQEEFTVLTPGGGEMTSGGRSLVPITDENRCYADVVIFKHYPTAVDHANNLNKALRDNGIDDRSYHVAKRTITKVTSEWDELA